MRDCKIVELKCPRTGRVFMWDLIEIPEVATVAEVAVETPVAIATKKPLAPTSMELKVWAEIGSLLVKDDLTLEETRALVELKSLMKMFATEHMITQGK